MKRIALFATIFLVATFGTALAQDSYDLSARGVEPARTHILPYHRMADAVKGDASQSRFMAVVEELSRSDEDTTATFTTHFALPVQWLNRQVILRVGYASSAYTLYINGREMGFSPSGVMGAEFNITKATREGRNEVVVKLDRALLANRLYKPENLVLEGIEIFSQPTIRVRDIVTNLTLNE